MEADAASIGFGVCLDRRFLAGLGAVEADPAAAWQASQTRARPGDGASPWGLWQ